MDIEVAADQLRQAVGHYHQQAEEAWNRGDTDAFHEARRNKHAAMIELIEFRIEHGLEY